MDQSPKPSIKGAMSREDGSLLMIAAKNNDIPYSEIGYFHIRFDSRYSNLCVQPQLQVTYCDTFDVEMATDMEMYLTEIQNEETSHDGYSSSSSDDDDTDTEESVQLKKSIIMFPHKKLAERRNVVAGEQCLLDCSNRPCVIKFDPDQIDSELSALTKLGCHSNVVSLFDSGTYPDAMQDIFYIVLEKCHDLNLENYVFCNTVLPLYDVSRGLNFCMQIIDGIKYIHEKLIIHKDLKPSNILLNGDLTNAKIADFGSSQEVESSSSMVASPNVFGTLGYRPPESLQRSYVSLKSDIYSLGVVFYFLLSNGVSPFGLESDKWDHNTVIGEIELNSLLVTNPMSTQHLIYSMLNVERCHRPSIEKVEQHPCWSREEKHIEFEYIPEEEIANPDVFDETRSESSDDENDEFLLQLSRLEPWIWPLSPAGVETKLPIELNASNTQTGNSTGESSPTYVDQGESRNPSEQSPSPKRRTGSLLEKFFSLFRPKTEEKGPLQSDMSTTSRVGDSRATDPETTTEQNDRPSRRNKRFFSSSRYSRKSARKRRVELEDSSTISRNRLESDEIDFDLSLQIVEDEISRRSHKVQDALQQLKNSIPASYTDTYVENMAHNLGEEGHYIRALILFQIANKIHRGLHVSIEKSEEWISHIFFGVKKFTKLLQGSDNGSRNIAITYGLRYMEEILIRDLEPLKGMSGEEKCLDTVVCLLNLASLSNFLKEYENAITHGEKGIARLQKRFGKIARSYGRYRMLLYNVGLANHYLHRFSAAEKYYAEDLDVCQISRFDSETDRTEHIRIVEEKLNIVRRQRSAKK